MKKTFTLFGILFTSLLFAQTSFKTKINSRGDGSIYSVTQLKDGNYVGVGYINEDIYLVKINSSGSLLSTKIIGTAGYDDGVSIIQTSDNNLAVSGVLNDQMAILKLDNDLNVIWQKSYPAGDNSYGYRLIQNTDGGYMIVGYTTQDSNYAGYLVKTNSQGEVLLSKQFFDFGNSTVNDIVATSDGNYALLAEASTTASGKDSSYLIKINSGGAVLWSKYLNTSTDSQYPSSLIQSSDGGFVIAGSVYQTFPNKQDPYSFEQMLMAKFSNTGDLLWSNKISPSKTSESYAYKVMEDKDGGYVFSGALSTFDKDLVFLDNYSYLVKLSSSGSLVLTRTFDASQENYTDFTDIIPTGNNGYAACGYTSLTDDDTDFEDGILYKFDAGFALCGDGSTFGNVDTIGSGVSKSIVTNNLTATASAPDITTGIGGNVTSLCGVLPVQLLSFNATLQNKSVTIEWKTASEVNTDYFVVERSNNSSSFTALQKLTAKGSASTVQTYTTTDLQPLPGTSYYRLQQVDKDGTAVYSGIVPVTVTANGTVVISPNPVQSSIRVLLQSVASSQVTFLLTDVSGKIIATQSSKVNTGTNTILIPASSLSKGIYILKVIENNSVQSVKFVKE